MKCCVECFKDIHIRNTIMRLGVTGDCDYCSHRGVAVYDIEVLPNPISDAVVGLAQIYSVSDLPEARPLRVSLHDDWDIFNMGESEIQKLTVDLCGSVIGSDAEVFSKNVIIPELLDEDFMREFGVVRGLGWEKFAESIKYKNRFHSGMFNADAFASFLSIIAKPYSAGVNMYRARISKGRNGYEAKDMSAPPPDMRSAGRINPEGIGVLYLSSDNHTVLSEVRATTFDYVSIGTFRLAKEIKVVNLSGISETSPFLYQGELEKYAANRKVFREIAREIAKPLRRNDSQLEYLPTQFIAEFIKSQGYDGVEYASTLREGGYNIAVFDETLFECVGVNTVEVAKIQYEIR